MSSYRWSTFEIVVTVFAITLYIYEFKPGNKDSTDNLIKLIYVITESCLKISLNIWILLTIAG